MEDIDEEQTRQTKWGKKVQENSLRLYHGEAVTPQELQVIGKVPSSTKRRWKTCFEEFGMTPHDWSKLEKKRLRKLGLGRTSRVMSDRSIERLEELALRHPDFYLDEIQIEFFRLNGILVDASTISRALHDRGLSIKVLGGMAEDLDDAHRKGHLDNLHDAADDPSMFILIDEAQKGRHAGRRRRVWTLKGHNPRGHFQHHEHGRYTFIAAADIRGFVISACATVMRSSGQEGLQDEDVGTIDRERFEQYVEYDLVPYLGNYALKEPHSVVVLDNSSNHTGVRTRELIEGAGARMILTAPLSPDLNPIESMFHVYKADLRRYRIADLTHAHFHAMLSVTPAMACRFFASLKGAIRNVVLIDDDDKEREENEIIEVAATAAAMAAAAVATATAVFLFNA
jgi:hypothetical protein